MINAHEMNSLAAVEVFGRLETGNAGASEVADIQADVVLHNVSVCDRNLGRVGYQDALEICVLHTEPRNKNAAEAGVVSTIYIDAVRQSSGVDDGIASVWRRLAIWLCQ